MAERVMDAIVQPKSAAAKASSTRTHNLITPQEVIGELEKHILVDGFKLVFDLAKSRGSRFYDAASGAS